MKEFIKPDWNNSNLNISATLAEFLGAPNNNATLPIIKEELAKGYKNVVFICFDGFGIYPIKQNLNKKDFLRQHIKLTLKSTFPATTANATTSLITNLLPREHGWLGWSLYFEEINKNVDIYLHSDSITGESVDFTYPIKDNTDCYFNKANTEYNITPMTPSYVQTNNPNAIQILNLDHLCESIRDVCNKEGKQFVYAYHPEPDATMHEYGVSSQQAKDVIQQINNKMEELFTSLENTLFIITADHGQIDIKGYIEFYKDAELNSMLVTPPFLDARTPAFKIKPGKEQQFVTQFTKKYGKDFKLFKSQELIEQGHFGDKGEYGYLTGDYVAIGTYTHKQFLATANSTKYKGHHTSLTEEMEVPLIILK